MKQDALTVQAEQHILFVRRQRVMLSHDLALLYGVETKVLNQAVKRNKDRFPKDFMFQIKRKEWRELKALLGGADAANLKSQFVTSSWGGIRRANPYAFTEQSVAMLSSVLRSKRAVQVNIEIMRAFVKLREMLSTHKDLARKLADMEKKYDSQFKVVFDAIRQLVSPTVPKKGTIGFGREKDA